MEMIKTENNNQINNENENENNNNNKKIKLENDNNNNENGSDNKSIKLELIADYDDDDNEHVSNNNNNNNVNNPFAINYVDCSKYVCNDLNNIRAHIDTYGVAVVLNVINKEKCETLYNDTWTVIENMSSEFSNEPMEKITGTGHVMKREPCLPIKRDDATTWAGLGELGPSTRTIHQTGTCGLIKPCWEVRSDPNVMEVFSKLHNVEKDQLVTSTDAFGFFLPNYNKKGYHGNAKKQPTNAEKLRNLVNLHVDTVYTPKCLERDYVQSFINVRETTAGQATFCFIPESHNLHFELAEKFPEKKTRKENFGILNPPELDWLITEKKKRVEALILPSGCMVLFYSRTVHCGAKPMVASSDEQIRLTFYVCQIPLTKKWITERELTRKVCYLKQGRTTTHQPSDFKLFDKSYNKRFGITQKIVYPHFDWTTLTNTQKQLVGLDQNNNLKKIN